jgi:hypothetical protein
VAQIHSNCDLSQPQADYSAMRSNSRFPYSYVAVRNQCMPQVASHSLHVHMLPHRSHSTCVCLQVLPAMGCVLPEDATLIAPNQLYGSLLSLVCTEEPLRQAWWSAESASASAAAKSIVVTADDAMWAALDSSEEPGQDAWQLDVVFTGVSSRMHALLARLFTRCMWLGAAPTRILMVQVVLGAAIDVCSPPSELHLMNHLLMSMSNKMLKGKSKHRAVNRCRNLCMMLELCVAQYPICSARLHCKPGSCMYSALLFCCKASPLGCPDLIAFGEVLKHMFRLETRAVLHGIWHCP